MAAKWSYQSPLLPPANGASAILVNVYVIWFPFTPCVLVLRNGLLLVLLHDGTNNESEHESASNGYQSNNVCFHGLRSASSQRFTHSLASFSQSAIC